MDIESIKEMIKLMAIPPESTVAGINLGRLQEQPSGICLLGGRKVVDSRELTTDKEIVAYASEARVNLATINQALTLGPGQQGSLRACELKAAQRGLRLFPEGHQQQSQSAVRRGIQLKALLEMHGVRTVEVYPAACRDIWGIGPDKVAPGSLCAGLEALGIEGLTETMGTDELDAVASAFTGYLFLVGQAEILGDFETGAVILPRQQK
ncbi:MAG: hypothetical protein U9P14_01255 [Gemmatimonadota bacterium]|nr:hypothetical protein [Gemmatimonadota bacterium]